MLEKYSQFDGGKEMDITTVPTLISHLYKNRSLKSKNIFTHSLPMKKLVLEKRFHRYPYFPNRLSRFHKDRIDTFSAKRHYGIGLNLLDILITWMKTKEAKISKQRMNDKYNLKASPSYPFKTCTQHNLGLESQICFHPLKCLYRV